MIITCCILGLRSLGTLIAREMVANARMPSTQVSAQVPFFSLKAFPHGVLTEERNHLRLQTELVLEARGKVVDAATSISSHIRHLANLVEHLPASKEENADQAHSSP